VTQEVQTPASPSNAESELKAASAAFAHETAAESAEVFEEVGQTAAEAADAFQPSLTDRFVDLAGPAIATVISKVGPAVAKSAVALAPVIDKAEAVAKPVLSKAEELLAPVVRQAEPWVNKAGETLSDVADVVAEKADSAAEVIDSATDRIKDTAMGLAGVAKPVAEEVINKVKSTVTSVVNRK
jgi:phage-related protein